MTILLIQSTNVQLEQKIQGLVELSARRPVIRLNGEKYRQYVKSAPKNYSIIVMLTALAPQRQCSICKYVNMLFFSKNRSYSAEKTLLRHSFFENTFGKFPWSKFKSYATIEKLFLSSLNFGSQIIS